jgi:hypothetical protein
VTGLGQQDQGYVQGQQAGMPAGTAPAPASVGQNANAALAVRQGIAGNFGVNQANTGAANNSYASNHANVVGPQQQLTALATKQGGINKVLKQKTALKGEEGAYNQEYRSNRRNDETKNLLAAGALGVNMTNATTAQNKAAATAKNNTPEAKAAATYSNTEARNAANYGYSVHDWRTLGPDGQARAKEKEKNKPADSRYSSGPFAGRTKSEIDAMSQGGVNTLLARYKNKKTNPDGPKLTTNESNTGMTQAVTLRDLAAKAEGGHPFDAGHGKQKPLTRAQAVQKIRGYKGVGGKIKDNSLLSAALDAAYDGHISAATARALKDAGFDPARVARSLHVPLGRSGANIPLNKK